MSLSIGTRQRHYELEAPTGAGGMGEVCRAKDTRLGHLYKAMAEALANMQRGRGPKDTPGSIEFALKRQKGLEAQQV